MPDKQLSRTALLCFAIVALQTPAVFAESCPTMQAGINVFITTPSGCTSVYGTGCGVGVPIKFDVSAFGYDFACAPHTFSWQFGDGATASGKTPSHTFAGASTYHVSVAVNNGAQQLTLTQDVVTGGPPPSPPPTPTPTPTPSGACQTMNPNDVFITFAGPTSGCTQNGGSCLAGEQLTLTVAGFPPYDFSCATHSFSWGFGGSTRTVTHAFSSTTLVQVTINNGSQSYTASATVPVSGSTPRPCGQITVSPIALPVVPVGASVNLVLTPSGGTPPYSIFVVGGSLPAGLVFWVNSIMGMPAEAGSFGFTIRIIDSRGCSATIAYTIVVSSSPSSCPLMVGDGNVFLTYKGDESGCRESADPSCLASESIHFVASAVGYIFSCATHAFTWNFGDAELAGGDQVTHVYRHGGTYAVTLTISNPQQSLQLTKSLIVRPLRHRAAGR